MNDLALFLIFICVAIHTFWIYQATKRSNLQDSLIFETLKTMDKMNTTLSSLNEDYEKLKERVEHLEEREIDE